MNTKETIQKENEVGVRRPTQNHCGARAQAGVWLSFQSRIDVEGRKAPVTCAGECKFVHAHARRSLSCQSNPRDHHRQNAADWWVWLTPEVIPPRACTWTNLHKLSWGYSPAHVTGAFFLSTSVRDWKLGHSSAHVTVYLSAMVSVWFHLLGNNYIILVTFRFIYFAGTSTS